MNYLDIGIILLLLFQFALAIISALVVIDLFRVFILKSAPFVRSAKKTWQVLSKELAESPGKILYDIGCGDGSLLFLAEKEKKMKVKGFEIGYLPFTLAKIKKFFYKSKAEIYKKNFFKQDLSDADFLFMYLLPRVVAKVEQEIIPKLKPGTIVICNTFKMPNRKPDKIVDVYADRSLNSKLYFYKI